MMAGRPFFGPRAWGALLVCCLFAPASAETIRWPLKPFNSPHAIGNSYGEYQWYGGAPYYHPGIDVLGAAGDSVFAVKAGYVKAVLTTSAELHWRVAVGDSAGSVPCDAYLYAHLIESSIQVAPGDTVAFGQYLGKLVTWPIASFHHCHFVKIRKSGFPWSSDWQFIHDPLDFITVKTDLDPPEFVLLTNGSWAAFYPNGGTTYLDPGDTLSGDLDFLVSVRDKINHPSWYVAPYQVNYRFRNDSLTYPAKISVEFGDTLWWDEGMDIIYRDDATYPSRGDYSDRDFYVICTNTDGDKWIEPGDADSAWFTGDYPNGDYWLQMTCVDRWGNRDDESLQVVLNNVFTFSGQSTLADMPGFGAGTVVSLPELGLSDTTNASGQFSIPGIGPGHYQVRVEHSGYDSVWTLEHITTRQPNRSWVLQPQAGLRGDLNHNGTVTSADILLLVNYVFKSGAPPSPLGIGDANGVPPITSADIVYLVAYVFKSGPPPPPM